MLVSFAFFLIVVSFSEKNKTLNGIGDLGTSMGTAKCFRDKLK